MQLYAPIFPTESSPISSRVAVQKQKRKVHYFANGMPIYVHGEEEQDSFRHIVCLLIEQGLCRRKEVVNLWYYRRFCRKSFAYLSFQRRAGPLPTPEQSEGK